MTAGLLPRVAAPIAVASLLALAPMLGNDYTTSLMINLMMYACLATAWGIFCGTTRYISLATVAFFGVGCYTVAVLGEFLPWLAVLAVSALLGGVLALIVGLATLRLSGMYFVIFTFGMAELLRQLATWYEANVAGSVGRYIFLDITPAEIYWQLLALFVVIWLLGVWLGRSRLGFALRLIGEDETAARQCGIDTVRVRLTVWVVTSMLMAITGAIVAPRWTYIDAAIAFNAMISFQVVVMALLGGVAVFYGPVLGVIPLVLAFEMLVKYFPNHFSIVLGAIFLLVVYGVPRGIVGWLQRPSRGEAG